MERNSYLEHYHEIVARNIRDIRVSRGLTQSQVGDILGITFQQVQKYEKGHNRVSGGTLMVLASFFKVHPSIFFQERGVLTVGVEDDSFFIKKMDKHLLILVREYNNMTSRKARVLLVSIAKLCTEITR